MSHTPEPVQRRTPTTHFIALDGLRGIAALFVVAFHALSPFDKANIISHAHLAVDFFFLLSGFVIAHAYENRLISGLSFGKFLKIRLIRLYPLIFVGLLLGFCVYVTKTVFLDKEALPKEVFLALVSNLILLPTNLIKEEGWRSIFPFNVPAWSLFFEFVVNIVYVMILPKLNHRILVTLVAISAGLVFAQAYHLGGIEGGTQLDTLLYGFGRVTFPFFAGVLLYRLRECFKVRSVPFLILGSILTLTFMWPGKIFPAWLVESTTVVFLYPVLVLITSQADLTKTMSRICRFLGDLSYPLYILYYPLIRLFSGFARKFAETDIQLYTIIAVEITCQVLFAYIILKMFDEPVRKWLKRTIN
ncbi:MAG: acyltransferase [Rhodospirillales bacterium]|nr:acyltransferase [Alphaproteobacteria bacterium]MCB9981431.1 acyltransferase [Rhodospirillales bacterium]